MTPYKSITERFGQIVREYGIKRAISYNDISYSYAELEHLTDILAFKLSDRYAPGTRIGCEMSRTQLWPVALLGIIKARCVYVPLDKANPQERLEQIIDDCNIEVILHDTDVEAFLASVEEQSPEIRLPQCRPDDLVYIIYTSGTTGIPKGVPIRNFQALMIAEKAIDCVFHAAPQEKVLQIASINFLVSLVEAFTALLNGCHLVIAGDDVKKDPQLLQQFLNENQVVRASIAPALLSAFSHTPMPFLKTIALIGEPVAQRVRDYWMANHQLVNCYGFTESALCIATGVYEPGSPVNDIGTLTSSFEGYILDENMNVVPDGTAGELYVGGPSLTEGYWNRPELNSTRFIENRYSHDENRCKVLYRTGDCMVRTPQGHLLYKGRSDDQVKIRGMRIETREVEMVLDSCSGVEKSVVTAREINGIKRLVAYLKPSGSVDTEQVKAQVAAKLPDFMCPSVYVIVDDFPLTLNRKIDKRRLPDPVWEVTAENKDFSVTENRLADIWGSLLGVRPQAEDDTFLSLGGDSLSIMYLAGLIEEQFGVTVSVSDLHQFQTLKDLAAFVDRQTGSGQQENHSLNENTDKIPLPLSIKDLWRECQMSEIINAAYQLLYEFVFPGDTDLSLLEQSWNIFLERQEAMRLIFYVDKNDVFGKILQHEYERLPLSDTLTASGFFEQARHQLEPEGRKLYRTQLIRRGDGTFGLCVALHHLITDGLSYQIISSQLNLIYKALLNKEPVTSKGVSYREYLEWKVKSEMKDLDKKHAFWKEYLDKLPPLSISIREGQHEGAGIVKLPMNDESCRRLNMFCKKHQVTVTNVVLSVYGYVVGKYLNQPDFVIGVAATDREEARFLNTAGYMVSMIPVRTLSSTDQSFSLSVEAMKRGLLDARKHPLPLSDLIASANVADGNYFMRIAYAIENERLDVLLDGVRPENPPFPLVLYASQTSDELTLALQYSRVFFCDGQIKSMAHCLVHVLDELLTEPDKSLDRCSMTQYIRPDVTDVSGIPTLMERFYEIAHEHPEWTAYRFQGQDYTYGALNEMSASFSSVMEEFQNNSNSRQIGVCINDRKYLLPIIMGLFRRGDCYVPIDTALPEKRIRHIIEDAQLSYIITDIEISELKDEVTLLSLDPRWFERRDHFVEQTPSRDAAAYIIFTSGSTGKPKGIPISQGNLAVYCSNFVNLTKMRAGMRVLQYASLGFDASVLEMFPALSAGATVVFPEPEQKTSTELLLSFFENEHIALSLIPPSLLAILPYRELPEFETLLVGGEATPKDVQERWRQGRTLINAYGPTENTVMATAMIMDDKTAYNNIGYPLSGVNCYVMDENRRVLPDYAIGELYISGAQLTSGYLNNDEQNRLHFFVDPYNPNQILYRSGDKVMRTSDGSFLFLGRVDTQMKVHGFRIEVSEIIKVLENIPDIRQAYVTVRKETADATLIAYCIREEDSSITEQGVLDIISNILPQYMVPSALMFIKEFPLNQSNKIDVSRLPINSPESLMVPPSTADEAIIEKAVCELLHKEHISVIANLFSEGLTSILAMVLIGVLKEQGLHYSYSDIYRYRTICELARHGQSKTWFWHSYSPSKPVVILVCGFTPVSPFYDEYIRLLADKYSILVFEAFPVYYATQQQKEADAKEYVDFMLQIARQQMSIRNFSVFAVTGHSLGSELGLLLAERLRGECCPDVRVLAIGTSLLKDSRINAFIGDDNMTLSQMLSSVPALQFKGDLRVVLENKPSSSVILSGEVDPEFEKYSEIYISKNNQLWKKTYPKAKILSLDASHFDLLQSQYLPQLVSLLDK
ncbi:MAG: amino acid adenylation domain-containing protein [Bacteroidaceae bacterium]|nr:amino acid adenylation domain-containing protein [Bacteroidaceae bacterium]